MSTSLTWRARMRAQEIELNTGDFKASGAFAEGLLSCAVRAGGWLRRIRVVQALPGRSGCTPKVVYGESGTRLEMYKGAQVRALGSGVRTVQG